MPIKLMSQNEVAQALASLPLWALRADGQAITRRFVFADFAQAFAFMTRVAHVAELQDHHPEWSNVWNRVDMALTTHAAGGITARDFRLARAIDGTA